jgi:predicted transglutaminase-like cysteine proteinase
MKRVAIAVLAITSCLAAIGLPRASATAEPAQPRAPERVAAFMRVHGQTAPPFGFVQFCDRQPEECAGGPIEESRLFATAERLAELDEINRVVNTAIEPVTDLELYGVEEYWTLPTSKGDCEDYALLKRHFLIKRGWPVSSLLITVVKDETGAGHAVLTARTMQGDFILDNKVATVKLWHRTGYKFIMRQSYLNPRIWLSLDPSQAVPPAALAGVRSKR